MAGQNLLTVRQIDGLRDGFHSDGGNLYLRVRGKGKIWVFRYKIRRDAKWASADMVGKPVELGLGSYPARSLKDARGVAESLRAEIANGRNPALILKPEAEAAPLTFKGYADEYITNHEGGWRNPKHKQQWRNTIVGEDAYAKSLWDKRPGDITAGDVQAMLLQVWAAKTETATRVRQRVETILGRGLI